MEREIENKFTREHRGIDLLWVLLIAICLAGAVTGTIVFSRSYTDADIDAFILSQRELPTGFIGCFVSMLLGEVPGFAALLLSALFVPGWLTAPAVLFIGGLSTGVSVCCIYSGCGLFGLFYAIPALVLPALCVLCARTILCHDSMLLSLRLMRSLFGECGSCRIAGRLMIKIPMCAAAEVFAAAFAALMRTLMYRFIS